MRTLPQPQTIQGNYYAQHCSCSHMKKQARGAWLLPTQAIYVEHCQPQRLSNSPIILPLFMTISRMATPNVAIVQLFGSSGVFRKRSIQVMDSSPWLAWRCGEYWTREWRLLLLFALVQRLT